MTSLSSSEHVTNAFDCFLEVDDATGDQQQDCDSNYDMQNHDRRKPQVDGKLRTPLMVPSSVWSSYLHPKVRSWD